MSPILFDTHCHVHDPEFSSAYKKPIKTMLQEARKAGVTQFVCVGTSLLSSQHAVSFAKKWQVYASLALHPHEVAEKSSSQLKADFLALRSLALEKQKQVVAIGECGLDYYYHTDIKVQNEQKVLFRQHIDLALALDLPLIFHIRSAFDDFFRILDDYAAKGHTIKGVVHSFSAHINELKGCLDRGLYIGLNGIMTFTKDGEQLAAAKAVPIEKLVLETDAPFLTPTPYRGKMCELHHIKVTAAFIAALRGESEVVIANSTTANAKRLFQL